MSVFYKNQPVMSTRLDSQGERQSKEDLEKIAAHMPPRFPLGQHHDMSKPYLGYMENFRVVPNPQEHGEWLLLADVCVETGTLDDALAGFSYGWTSNYRSNRGSVEGAVYLPYPYYNDEALIDRLLDRAPPLQIGKWHKKAAAPDPLGLIVSFVLFILAGPWQKLYDTKVHPYLMQVVGRLKETLGNLDYHYGFHVRDEQGRTVSVYLIPAAREALYLSQVTALKAGLEIASAYLQTNEQAKSRGVYLLKLRYDSTKGEYAVLSVQFNDGTSEWYGG
jgi:hypothetical protein